MEKPLPVTIFAVALISFGVVCFVSPDRVLEFFQRTSGTKRKPLGSGLKPQHVIWSIRMSGAGAILLGLFVELVVLTGR